MGKQERYRSGGGGVSEGIHWFSEHELRILRNFLNRMPKAYRKRTPNFAVVMDILRAGTSTAGKTSCCEHCKTLGIDPYGYSLESEVDEICKP